MYVCMYVSASCVFPLAGYCWETVRGTGLIFSQHVGPVHRIRVLEFGHSASNGAPSARANARAIGLTWETATFRNGEKWVCRARITYEYLGNGW